MATKKKIQAPRKKIWDIKLLAIIVTAFIAYIPSLNNGFLNWDDIIYVMNNDMIKKLSADNLLKMWSSFYMGNYHPFIIMSFAFDYSFFQLNATGYHVHNTILHLVNSMLVYIAFYYIFSKNINLALIVSLLFAIHPMHVESVAWISERKDLLYTLYFMSSLIAYMFYINTTRTGYLLLTLLLFLFSLLAKAQAVTLPLVLILIDYLHNRKLCIRTVAEKVPFFIVALFFGILAIFAQKADGSVNPKDITVFHSFFYAFYSLVIYLLKFVFPVFLTCLYEYPVTEAGTPPFYVFIAPIIIVVLFIIIFKTWKKQKSVTFGILFFLLTIFPVLQFLPVGQAIVAERYTYIPYLGLFVLAGLLFLHLLQSPKKSIKSAAIYIGMAAMLLFTITTFNRNKVWFDSVSLWTDVLEKNPKSITAFVNRGYMYNQYQEYDKAIYDCNEGLKLDSNYFKFYINRGVSFRNTGRFDLAIADFSKAIEKNPKSFDTYLDRGILYTDQLMKYDQGISDFKVFLGYRPDDVNGNYNLGVAYYKKQDFDSSLVYCDKAIRLSPETSGPYFIKALISEAKGNFTDAYSYGSKARQLGYSIDNARLELWRKNAGIPSMTLQ